MDSPTFQRILKTFSDRPEDIIFDRDTVVFQMQGTLVGITIEKKDGLLYIIENDHLELAENWIKFRLAQLPTLANRIIDNIKKNDAFVSPNGQLMESVGYSNKINVNNNKVNAYTELRKNLDKNAASLSTNVIYLTAHAGEGKTTLINELAVTQARRFIEKKKSYLVLPIQLGGRTFMRLDDIISGIIMNKYRFRHFYYDGFIEMVKMGLIVPALDGFEEMFIVDSTGETISSLGCLLSKLDSQGQIIIAARKAFFEYYDFEYQAFLLDTIKEQQISFNRLQINRWSKEHFLSFLEKNKITKKEGIYNSLSEKLGADHPMLTRAMLVKQIVYLAKNNMGNWDSFCAKIIKDETTSWINEFVKIILERETQEKWLERTGQVARPLISIEKHHELLSDIALEMYNNNKNTLTRELLDFTVNLFCERNHLHPNISTQISSRINDHPLLIKVKNSSKGVDQIYSFDHEEFLYFFMGEALARLIINEGETEIRLLFRKNSLPKSILSSCLDYLKHNGSNYEKYYEFIEKVSNTETNISFARENSLKLLLNFIQKGKLTDKIFNNYLPHNEAFSDIQLSHIRFINCFFTTATFEKCSLINCQFVNCNFDTINLKKDVMIKLTTFIDSKYHCINQMIEGEIISTFDPYTMKHILEEYGVILEEDQKYINVKSRKSDMNNLEIVAKAFRLFSRSTYIHEEIFKLKLGKSGNMFLFKLLPKLEKANILAPEKIEGHKKYKLLVPMSIILQHFKASQGEFEKFLSLFEKDREN